MILGSHTGNVLGQELSPNHCTFRAVGRGIPYGLDSDVCVVSWCDLDIANRSVAENGVIGKNVNVDVGDGS